MSVSTDRTPLPGNGESPAIALGIAALLGFGGLFVGAISGEILVSIAAGLVPITPGSAAETFVKNIGTYTALTAVGVVFLLRYDVPLSYVRSAVPSLRDFGWMGLTIVAMGVFLLGIVQAVEALGLPMAEHGVGDAIAENPAIALVSVPLSILLVAPAEEFLYRGVIQTYLGETFGVIQAVLVGSAVFASVHILAYSGGDPTGLLVTILFVLFPLGALLGAVYEYTDNLVVPVVAHGVYNAAIFGISYAEVVGLF